MPPRNCQPLTLDEKNQRSSELYEKTTGRAVRQGTSDIILAHSFHSGQIDAESLALNSRIVTRPKAAGAIIGPEFAEDVEMSVFDIFNESLLINESEQAAIRRTASEVAKARKDYGKIIATADVAERGIPTPKELSKLAKVNLGYMGLIREGYTTSPFRVFSAATMDAMGNAWFQTIAGHPGIALKTLNPRAWVGFAKFTMRPGTTLDHSTVQLFKRLNIDIPPEIINIQTRDLFEVGEKTQAANIFGFGGRFKAGEVASTLYSSRWGRAARHGVDGNARLNVLGSQTVRELKGKRIAIFRDMRAAYGDDVAQQVIDEVRGYTHFTTDDIRDAVANHKYQIDQIGGIPSEWSDPDAVARRWRSDVQDAANTGISEVKRIHFSMQATRGDEWARHVMLFHFWQSRAAVFYPRTVIGNPYLLYNHIRFYEAVKNEADRQGINPLNMYFKWQASASGWFFQMDPLSYIIPYTMMRDWAKEYRDESFFDKWARRFGTAVNPGIGAALSVIGASDQFPTLLPNATRGAIVSVANFMRNHGMDLGFGPGITGDPLLELERKVENSINNLLADHGLARDVEPFDPTVNDAIIVNDIIIRNAEADFGMSYEEMLNNPDPKYRDAVAQAQIAVKTGQPNDRAEDALAEWSTYDQGLSTVVKAVIPGYIPIRSGTTTSRREKSKSGDTNAREITRQVESAGGSVPAITLNQENEAYQRLGTDQQRAHAATWNAIVYDEFDPWVVEIIGGKLFTGAQLSNMTTDQRMKLADAWVLERTGPKGKAELESYRTQRKEFAGEHTELAGYQDFTKRARDYDGGERHVNKRARPLPNGSYTFDYEVQGGVRSFRKYLEGTPGNPVSPEFADEIQQQRDYLKSTGLSGEELERRLDSWTLSPEGYNAARGVQQSAFDAPPKKATDTSNLIAPAGPLEGGQSTASASTKATDTPKKTTSTERPKWQRDLVTEWDTYQAAIRQFEAANGSIDNYSNPNGQIMLQRYLPEPSRDLNRYLNWASEEIAAGRDGSMEAYLAYRDAQYRGETDTDEETTDTPESLVREATS